MKLEEIIKEIENLTIAEIAALVGAFSGRIERSQKCEYFDSGTCCNPEEFGIGSTEIHEHYCKNTCKYNKDKNG